MSSARVLVPSLLLLLFLLVSQNFTPLSEQRGNMCVQGGSSSGTVPESSDPSSIRPFCQVRHVQTGDAFRRNPY